MKSISLFALIFFFGIECSAQKLSSDKVPQDVMAAFKKKYPDVSKATWEMEDTDYEAEFKNGGKEISVSFNSSGKWVETETEMKISDLPDGVKTYLSNNFKEYKIKEVCNVESSEFGNCFELEIKKGKDRKELLVSPEGKLLITKKGDSEK